MIPAAIREIRIDEYTGGRFIVRTVEAGGRKWFLGVGAGVTTERDEAHIYSAINPETMFSHHILELLDEPAVPPAVEEMRWNDCYEIYGVNSSDPRINRKCITRIGEEWYQNGEHGIVRTHDRNQATVWPSFGQARGGNSSIVEFLDPIVVPKLINTLFPADFIKLMETAPKNETVRGHILRVTKQLPPEDCDTPDKLEAWLQEIYKSKPAPTPDKKAGGLKVLVEFTENETGTCRYVHRNVGRANLTIPAEELEEIINNSTSISQAMDAVRDYVGDEQPNLDPGMETENTDYDSYDADEDQEGRDWDYNAHITKSNLMAWIQSNLPEAARRLGLTE